MFVDQDHTTSLLGFSPCCFLDQKNIEKHKFMPVKSNIDSTPEPQTNNFPPKKLVFLPCQFPSLPLKSPRFVHDTTTATADRRLLATPHRGPTQLRLGARGILGRSCDGHIDRYRFRSRDIDLGIDRYIDRYVDI